MAMQILNDFLSLRWRVAGRGVGSCHGIAPYVASLARRPSGRHTLFGVGVRCSCQPHWSRAFRLTGQRPRPAGQEVLVRRVLLLNITYEPLTTVALHRAVCLVLGEKADVLHDDSSGE